MKILKIHEHFRVKLSKKLRISRIFDYFINRDTERYYHKKKITLKAFEKVYPSKCGDF